MSEGRNVCSRCGIRHDRDGQRYCVQCHDAYMRNWRKTNPLTDEQKVKHRARAYARVYRKRGVLVQMPCERCGSPETQMHHQDYSKPLEVNWFCRPCHLAEHQSEVPSTTIFSREPLCSNIAAQIEQRYAGRRQRVHHGGKLCSCCYAAPPRGPSQRYCRQCHSKHESTRQKAKRSAHAAE